MRLGKESFRLFTITCQHEQQKKWFRLFMLTGQHEQQKKVAMCKLSQNGLHFSWG